MDASGARLSLKEQGFVATLSFPTLFRKAQFRNLLGVHELPAHTHTADFNTAEAQWLSGKIFPSWKKNVCEFTCTDP